MASSKTAQEINRLRKELDKQLQLRESLTIETSELKESLQSLEENNQVANEDSIWYQHYLRQCNINAQLEEKLGTLTDGLSGLSRKKTNLAERMDRLYTKEIELKREIQRLQRDKLILEWEVHNDEWRLNRESKNLRKIEDNVTEIRTKLNEAMLKIIDTQHLSRDLYRMSHDHTSVLSPPRKKKPSHKPTPSRTFSKQI